MMLFPPSVFLIIEKKVSNRSAKSVIEGRAAKISGRSFETDC
jgi:hypothetical protein